MLIQLVVNLEKGKEGKLEVLCPRHQSCIVLIQKLSLVTNQVLQVCFNPVLVFMVLYCTADVGKSKRDKHQCQSCGCLKSFLKTPNSFHWLNTGPDSPAVKIQKIAEIDQINLLVDNFLSDASFSDTIRSSLNAYIFKKCNQDGFSRASFMFQQLLKIIYPQTCSTKGLNFTGSLF